MESVLPITPGWDWRDLLGTPGERHHTVQLYNDLGFLTEAVSHFAGAGIVNGDAVLFVATPDHSQAFTQRLTADGFDVDRLRERGQLTLLDAADTLSRFMVNGQPDAGRFMPFIGETIDRARAGGRYPGVRAYGEMVNLLWEKGELSAALRIEELWNDLSATRALSLHCAYAMDGFDTKTQCGALHAVHHAHSHLIPVEDYSRFDEAVNRALADVLGPTAAIVLKPVLVARQRSGSRMPAAQAALLGLSELLPTAVDAVLLRSRRYYGTGALEHT